MDFSRRTLRLKHKKKQKVKTSITNNDINSNTSKFKNHTLKDISNIHENIHELNKQKNITEKLKSTKYTSPKYDNSNSQESESFAFSIRPNIHSTPICISKLPKSPNEPCLDKINKCSPLIAPNSFKPLSAHNLNANNDHIQKNNSINRKEHKCTKKKKTMILEKDVEKWCHSKNQEFENIENTPFIIE